LSYHSMHFQMFYQMRHHGSNLHSSAHLKKQHIMSACDWRSVMWVQFSSPMSSRHHMTLNNVIAYSNIASSHLMDIPAVIVNHRACSKDRLDQSTSTVSTSHLGSATHKKRESKMTTTADLIRLHKMWHIEKASSCGLSYMAEFKLTFSF